MSKHPATIIAKLRQTISQEVLPLAPTFSDDDDLYQEGLDSMAMMQLILALENQFDVRVEPTDLAKENFQSLNSIAAFIAQKIPDA